MATRVRCGGCPNLIDVKEFLRCRTCKKSYDLICANKSVQNFHKMTKEDKKQWDCEECKSRKPKTCNQNTPVRTRDSDYPSNLATSEIGMDCTGVITRARGTTRPTTPPSLCSEASNEPVSNSGVTDICNKVLEAIQRDLPAMFARILNKELATLRTDLQKIQDSVQFLSDSHDDFKKSVDSLIKDNAQLKKENKELQATVNTLSERLNNVEQHLRENNLELHGVPEFKNENLLNLLQQCSKAVGYQPTDGDVIQCTRVAKLNRESKLPKTIIARFRSTKCRDEFYSAVYRYNKANPDNKLNTSMLGIAGDKKPIYISEHLSPTNKALHAAARQKAKDHGYSFVWIRNGRIYVRKEPSSTYIHIKNSDSLALII